MIPAFGVYACTVQVDEKTYVEYESGNIDLPFSFIHKCALAFGIELTEENKKQFYIS